MDGLWMPRSGIRGVGTVQAARADICPSPLAVFSRDGLEMEDEFSAAETLAMVSEAIRSRHAVSRIGTGDLAFARSVHCWST